MPQSEQTRNEFPNKLMRANQVKYIAIHCSATPPDMDIGADWIRDLHVNSNGWSDIGYHYVIRRNGEIEKGRDTHVPGAHVKGFNRVSIGVCMVGGVESDGKTPSANFTYQQWDTLESLMVDLVTRFTYAKARGHRDFPNVNKACPCFDVGEWAAYVSLYAARQDQGVML